MKTMTRMTEHIKYEIDFIPVRERLPTEEYSGVSMHVLTDEGQFTLAYYEVRLMRWINPYLSVAVNVTHWARFKK